MDVSEEQGSIITSRIKWPSLGNKSYEDLIIEESEKEGIDPSLPLAIHYAGEQYHPERAITSPRAATGPMQLIPSTAKMLGVDPRNERQNISGGVRYVKQMLKEFDNDEDLAIAAYNAGPGAVRRYKGIPPFKETRDYHKRVTEYRSKPPSGLQWEPVETPPEGLVWEPVGIEGTASQPQPKPPSPSLYDKATSYGNQALDAVRPFAEGMAPVIPEADLSLPVKPDTSFLQGQAPAPEIQPQPQPEPNLPPSEAIQQVAAPAMDRLGTIPEPPAISGTPIPTEFSGGGRGPVAGGGWGQPPGAIPEKAKGPTEPGWMVGPDGPRKAPPPSLFDRWDVTESQLRSTGKPSPGTEQVPPAEIGLSHELEASRQSIDGMKKQIDIAKTFADAASSPEENARWVKYHNDLGYQLNQEAEKHNATVERLNKPGPVGVKPGEKGKPYSNEEIIALKQAWFDTIAAKSADFQALPLEKQKQLRQHFLARKQQWGAKNAELDNELKAMDMPLEDIDIDGLTYAAIAAATASPGGPVAMATAATLAFSSYEGMKSGGELGARAEKGLAGTETGIGAGIGAGLAGAGIPLAMWKAAGVNIRLPDPEKMGERAAKLVNFLERKTVTINEGQPAKIVLSPEDIGILRELPGAANTLESTIFRGMTKEEGIRAWKQGIEIDLNPTTMAQKDRVLVGLVKKWLGIEPYYKEIPGGMVSWKFGGGERPLEGWKNGGVVPDVEIPAAPEPPVAPVEMRGIAAPEGIPRVEPVPSAPTVPRAITAPEVVPPAEPVSASPLGLPPATTEAVPVGKPYGEVGVAPIPMEGEVTPKQIGGPEADVVEPEPTGPTDKIYLPDKTAIEVRYRVREFDDLITSHDWDGKINPVYPEKMQPRDRERVASRIQMQKIAADLTPEWLGKSPDAGKGAPITGPDDVVESGNARVNAIRLAYWKGKAGKYRQWLRDNAEEFGSTPEQVDAMKRPGLTRERITDVDRVEFARQANKDDKLSMGPAELARVDADRITSNHMDKFKTSEDGDVLAASNNDFVRKFLETLGSEEAAQYLTGEGKFTKQLGDRIQAAIFERAYANPRLLAMATEEADPDIKTILNALNRAAPEFAKNRDLGITDEIDIVPFISEAAGLIQQAKFRGATLDQLLSQMPMLQKPSDEAVRLAKYFASNIRSSKRMGEMLTDMGEEINAALRKSGETQATMSKDETLSRKEIPTARDIIDSSLQRAEDIHAGAKGQQQTLFNKRTPKGGTSKGEPAGRGRAPTGGPGGAGVGEPSAEYGAGKARTALKAGDITTPEFREWSGGLEPIMDATKHEFKTGDSGVVKLYHGTSTAEDFEQFSIGDIGFHFGSKEQAAQRAEDTRYQNGRLIKGRNPRIIPAYVKFNKLLRLPDVTNWGFPTWISDELVKRGMIDEAEATRIAKIADYDGELAELKRKIKLFGYDGIVYRNLHEGLRSSSKDWQDSFIAFEPTQIKSIWNKGSWSKTDPRILSEPESRLEPKTKGQPDAKELQAEWERLINQAGKPVGPVSSAGGALGPAQKWQATQKGQPQTIAKSFQQQLEKKQRIEFRGIPISGPEDLAELGHKYLRQAEFEVFHVFLVVDGKIGAHEAVSSRLPGSAVPFADVDKAIWQMRNRADRLRAKAKAAGNPGEIRIFRLHNHPTGYVAPSDKDLEFDSDLVNIAPRSEKTTAWIPEMDSHIIIDGEEWAEIDVNGGVTYHDFTLPEGWKDPVLTPSLDHPLLSATIVSPGDIADIGKALESETDMPVLMYYSGSEAKVRGIQGMPRSILMSKGAGPLIRGQALVFGSQYVALYDPNPTVEAIRQYRKLYQNGHLVDYVHPAGKGYASGLMKSGERIAPAQADKERWQGKTALKPGVRVAEKRSWYGAEDEVAELGVAGRSTTGPIPSSGDIPRPTRRSKIIKDLAKAFDVPIRLGRFRQKAAGIYKYGPKVIRLKKANDVEVAVHEIGHHIENLLGLGGRQPDEVRNMAYAGAKSVDREGFAEFLRYYVTNPTVAQTQAPAFYTRFEQALDQNPDVRDVLIKARMAWQEWQATPSIGKVMSFIVRGSEAPKPRWTLSKVYTALLDELHPLKMLRDFAGGKLGHELPILKDPYALAWLTRGWARKAEQILKWGQYKRDAQGQLQKIGPSFRDILGPIEEAGERHLLDAYLVAKRGVNDPRILQGFEGVISPDDLQQTVTELEPRFRETAEKLYELSSNLLDMLVDSGRITKDAADQIRNDNQFYTPLYRVMDIDSRIGGLSKKKFGNVFSPIKRLKGSSRDIFSPTENYMYNIFAFVNSAERNKIGEAMIGVSKIDGMGEVIEKLPVKMSPTKISKDDFMALLKKYGDVEQISSVTQTETETTNQLNSVGPTSTDRMDAVVKEALTARGWTDAEATQIIGRVKNAANPQERTDIIEKTVEKTTVMVIKEKLGFGNMPDQMIANFRPNYNPAPDEVIFYNRGKPEVYWLAPELHAAIMASNPETLSLIVKVLAFPAKLLRAGATTTLEFMARNPLRDQMTAYVYSDYGYKPGWDLLKGIAHILGKSEIYQAYNESGAAHAALVSMDRNYLSKSYDDLMNSNRVKGIAKQIIKNPIELLRALSEITEEATRVGEFAKAYTKGGKTAAAGAEAGIAARDMTLDFSRHGSQTASISAIVAFWNAQLQGSDKMVRAFKTHPWRTLFRSIAGITLPSLLLWAAQKDDPAYQEIPTWRRILFWNIVTHKADGSVNHIWSIPRPFELGIMFGAVPEMMLDWYHTKDPEGAKEVVRSFLQAALPSYMPTALIPMVEWISGYSLFFDRPIVQRGKEQLRPSLQYGPNTSEFLKLVARNMEKVPGMKEFANPAKLQNLIQGYSAGLGRMGLEGIDSVLKATGLVKVPLEPSLTLSDMPGIRAFVARYPGANTRSIEKFYRHYNQMVTDYESAKEDIGIRGMSKLDKGLKIKNKPLNLQDMQDIAQALSVFRTVADVVHKSNPKVSNSTEADTAREVKRQQLDKIYLSMIALARIGIGLEPMRSIPAPVKTEVAK